MSRTVNVTVLQPGATVTTMQDELQDGSVANAVQAAIAAYRGIDSDGDVPVVNYDEDFDDAVAKAVEIAGKTDGDDLLVIISDLECNDPNRAERLLADLDGDFVVIVPVSNQGYNQAWAQRLDDDSPAADKIDVITVEGLSNRETAFAEVDAWLKAAA